MACYWWVRGLQGYKKIESLTKIFLHLIISAIWGRSTGSCRISIRDDYAIINRGFRSDKEGDIKRGQSWSGWQMAFRSRILNYEILWK